MNHDVTVAAENVSVQKDKKTVLDDVTFTLQPGKLVGLIGPSGSGKTTLLRSIVGVQKVSQGTLTVLGLKAGTKLLRPKIGYVTQTPAIYDDLTVFQNIMYFAKLFRASQKQADEVLQTVRLQQQKNQLAGSLSGGQRARVSLAMALLGDPDVLIFDEPTVGLDPLLRRELWNVFSGLAKSGKTIIVSSHVMDEAERCDELLLLREGKLLWRGALSSLLQKTKSRTIEEAFIVMIQKGKQA